MRFLYDGRASLSVHNDPFFRISWYLSHSFCAKSATCKLWGRPAASEKDIVLSYCTIKVVAICRVELAADDAGRSSVETEL